jgi:glucose/arabinose dehydrogenase
MLISLLAEEIPVYFVIKIILPFLLAPNSLALAQTEHSQAIIKQLHVPDGFELSIYVDNVPNARSLALGDHGIVYVGTGAEGKVYALEDNNGDGIADSRYSIASALNMPNGVAFKDNSLYVAEINRIIRFDHISQYLENPPKPVVIYDQFPTDQHHGWKYLRFGPDNKLYTAVGAPCNICNADKPIYTSLIRLNADGSYFEILARGIRNTVGFDWQPGTRALFFTDNGRDYLGVDLPPDELNQWSAIGEDFGFPYCHAGYIRDPEFGGDKICTQFKAPTWQFKAHVAPLGLRFYQGQQFPATYQNQLFVALHGSWNRTKPDGYRVALITFNQNKPISEQIFIDGWLTKEDKVLGRPVDILEMPDGSLLISDDTLGVIYKLAYKGNHDKKI